MLERFRLDLLRDLRTDLPEQARPHSDRHLLQIIDDGVLRARHYGVTTARDATLFIYLTVMHSVRFEDKPAMAWAKKILLKPDMEGEAKMSLVWQMAAARSKSA